MTNLDSIIENAALDMPERASPNLPKRPGLWRVISLLAVAAALVVSAMSILQSRDASNVAVPDREPVALETSTVTAADLDVPGGASIAVLGLAESDSRRDFSAAGTQIDMPQAQTAVVGVTNTAGDLIGLAAVAADQDRTAVEVSATSTARALILLAPGILRPNLTDSFANTDIIEGDPAFAKLVDAIRMDQNLSADNELVEQAFAEIADRLPAIRPPAEQGCDSVIARDAYTSAGTCVQPESAGLVIANNQDRWVIAFNGDDGYATACAAISPSDAAGSDVLVPSEQCRGEALLAAPGPIQSLGDGQARFDERVRQAAAVMQLYEYTGPFADLVGASAGFNGESVSHIRRNTAEIVEALAFLIETDDEFAAAMDVNRMATTALDRHNAAVVAARTIIEAADTTALIPPRIPGNDSHRELLDFYSRAGERMVAPRTDWRWDADAVGLADFEASS